MARAGNTTARGYGGDHQRRRRDYQALVASGRATCWRCQLPIPPGSLWDLGHDDHNRSIYRGPEHRSCNRAAGARRSHGKARRRIVLRPQRNWYA